jgi:transposase InsO family protein
LALLFWSRWFPWRSALVVVKPETLIGWLRQAFQVFWRWKSRGGRPKLPKDLRILIAEMVRENRTWGEARIAAGLALKLGIRISAHGAGLLAERELRPHGARSQRWMTFVRNHAKAMVACDFAVAVTLHFRILYVLLVIEVGSRKLVHVNATAHPTSSWTSQQLGEAIPSEHMYRWLIHDRSGIFSEDVDQAVRSLGVKALKTPVRGPQANAYCERLIGGLRRECLDWFLALNERHLRTVVRDWAAHYNQGRPHRSLGPADQK